MNRVVNHRHYQVVGYAIIRVFVRLKQRLIMYHVFVVLKDYFIIAQIRVVVLAILKVVVVVLMSRVRVLVHVELLDGHA